MSQISSALIQEGLQRQRAGFSARAARLYRRVPPGDEHYSEALRLLGMLSVEQGRMEEAVALLERSIRARADAAATWDNLGGVAERMGRTTAAIACYRRAVVLAPGLSGSSVGLARLTQQADRIRLLIWAATASPCDEAVLREVGSELVARRDLAAASTWFRRLLTVHPAASATLFSLGNALRDLKRPEEAERLYRRTLCLLPGSGNVQNNLGLLAFVRGDWATAESWFAASGRGDPRLAAAWSNRARALQKLNRDAEAIVPYKRALATDPSDVSACCELAGLLEAERWARRAMVLDPVSPKPYNRMALLSTKTVGRVGVLRWLHRGAIVRPDDADAWYNIGVELGRAGDPQGAVTYGTYATRVNDNHASAHLNTALALLAQERFREGWRAHRRRLETSEGRALRRFFDIPLWQDAPIAGRHLLLWGEQGIGDEVQFLTLAPHLIRLGIRLTILAEERLRPIIRRSFPDAAVPDIGPPTGELEDHHGADLHLALGDLPDRLNLFCGGDATPESWIVPDPERAAALRSALQARHPGKTLIGITWRSIAPKTGARRTIAPALWRDVLTVPDVAVVSLQYGVEPQEIRAFEAEAGGPIDGDHGVDPMLDLDGLAALVSAMDLVVCPANNTVHFAGALAKPCWTLVPTRPDWRWGLERRRSLWYPRTDVYRQESDDDWSPVMARVARDLASWHP